MEFHTFGPGLALDPLTMRGVPAMTVYLEDADTGDPVQAFNMDIDPAEITVRTNRFGYFPQFQVSAEIYRLRIIVGEVELIHTAWEVIHQARAAIEYVDGFREEIDTEFRPDMAQLTTLVNGYDTRITANTTGLAALSNTVSNLITVDTSVGTRVFVGDTMIYGDTGWRDISHLLSEDWRVGANQGRVRIKRQNSTIHLDLRIDRVTEGRSRALTSRVLNAPVGFQGTAWSNILGDAELYDLGQIGRVNAMGVSGAINVKNFSGTWGEGDRLFLLAQWEVDRSHVWMTSLPGNPA